MTKDRQYIGIDISKDNFDASFPESTHQVYENNHRGYSLLLKQLFHDAHVVMEQTGPYHLKLALYLAGEEVKVSVVSTYYPNAA